MKTIVTILAGICAAFLVLSGVASLVLFFTERGAFSPEPYKRAFESLGLYDRMPSILASTVFSSPASLNGIENPIWALMTSDGLEAGLAFLLPPAELKTMTDMSLDSIFAYINDEADSASLPLTPLKDRLAGPEGADAVLGLLGSQPACTTEQLFQMTFGALSGGGFFLCNPPPEAIELFKPLIQSQLQITASIIPDEVPLIPGDRSGTDTDPRPSLNRLRAWMQISPVLPVVLLLMITILTVRNLVTFLNWWGYPLLFTGGITFLLALAGAPAIGFILQFLIESQFELIASAILVETLRETTSAVAREILRPMILVGIILAAAGFVMALAGFFLRRRTQPSAP
jgi:hypothetical protein